MIEVNGKELDEHGLRAKAEARRRAGLYDERTLALLERDIVEEIEEHVFSMIQVVFDLQRSLEDAGARLEPPADLSTAGPEVQAGRLGSFLRRLQTRLIRAVNEGYVQQQEKFNTCFTKAVDLSYRQLCGAIGGIELEEAAERRDLWASRRPEWSGEVAMAVSALGTGKAVVVGIAGAASLEKLHEERRLLLALDTCDDVVGEAQARFIPAWFHPRPVELLPYLQADGIGLVVVAFPECLTGGELERLFAWAGSRMGPEGTVLISLNRGWSEGLSGDPGFVRYWPRHFLASLLRGAGFEAEVFKGEGCVFLKGERKA